ncbi:MAG: hypothetical protein ACW99Q_15250, partial [Candidatus Kariarchaeaceae archaeon]
MQTNKTEDLALRSEVYFSNTSVTIGDNIAVDALTNTDSQIDITFLLDGDISAVYTLLSQGNND